MLKVSIYEYKRLHTETFLSLNSHRQRELGGVPLWVAAENAAGFSSVGTQKNSVPSAQSSASFESNR